MRASISSCVASTQSGTGRFAARGSPPAHPHRRAVSARGRHRRLPGVRGVRRHRHARTARGREAPPSCRHRMAPQ
jgi:hypothetical protein